MNTEKFAQPLGKKDKKPWLLIIQVKKPKSIGKQFMTRNDFIN
jgi:hypothetical protein